MSSIKYRPEIDGLRAIAVLLVIFFHAGFEYFGGGYVGVDVFFVISGYLITKIILKEIESGKFSLVTFYERRARRILPALLFVILTCIPFAWFWMPPNLFLDFSKSIIAVSIFSSNILFWRESNYFATSPDSIPLLHTWSLAVEEQFYIIFPVALLIMYKTGRKNLIYAFIILAVISLVISEWGWRYHENANFYLIPTRAWELMLGVIVALASGNKNEMMISLNLERFIRESMSLLGLILILYSASVFDETTPFPSLYTLIPTLGALFIIIFTAPGTWVYKFLSMPAFVGLGLISYSAYLWHQPLFVFTRLRNVYDITHSQYIGIIGVVFLLAFLSWKFIETPFRKRTVVELKYLVTFSIVMSVIFILIGTTVIIKEGLPKRFEGNSDFLSSLKWEKDINNIMHDMNVLAKRGRCLYGGKISHDDFLDKWDCKGGSGGGKIIFFGDSHAADKAVSIVLNNLNPAWMTGGNCSIVPSFMTPKCREKFDFALSDIELNKIGLIALSNRFEKKELQLEYAKEIIAYWGKYNLPVVIFTNMPIFESPRVIFPKAAMLGLDINALEENIKYDVARESEGFVKTIEDMNPNFFGLNTREMLCSMYPNGICSWLLNGRLMLVDQDHFTVSGAKSFGKKLKQELERMNLSKNLSLIL